MNKMLLSLIALSLVIRGATAKACGNTIFYPSEKIHTQEDLDVLENDCTTLINYYEITTNFTGPFVLPGIVGIHGLRGGFGPDVPLNISAFEMPDLEFAESIVLQRLSYLEGFDVPKLEETGILNLDIDSNLDILDVPALEQTSYLKLKGNFTDISFAALQKVTDEMIVTNRRPTISPETSMNLSFPSLNSSSTIAIEGKASSISLPELTSLTSSAGRSSNFSLWGEDISIDLPKLKLVAGNIVFEGNITSLSLPSLHMVTENLTVNAGNPLSIDLPVRYASVINLVGKIKSVNLPNLIIRDALRVNSDLPFDCEEFLSNYHTHAPTTEVSCVSRSATDDTTEDSSDRDDPSVDDGDSAVKKGDESEESNQNGDNTSSAASNGQRNLSGTILIALVVIGLLGL